MLRLGELERYIARAEDWLLAGLSVFFVTFFSILFKDPVDHCISQRRPSLNLGLDALMLGSGLWILNLQAPSQFVFGSFVDIAQSLNKFAKMGGFKLGVKGAQDFVFIHCGSILTLGQAEGQINFG
jgi:hypothetical protein